MREPIAIGSLLESLRLCLYESGRSELPSIEAQWILEKVSGLHRPELLTHPERTLPAEQAEAAREIAARYNAGEPLPYLLGEWSFFGNAFFVTPAVLIPRPETELLVEMAVRWLKAQPSIERFYDVGTGSGCIALSILKQFPWLKAVATDVSMDALQITRKNRAKFGLADCLTLVQADLLEPISDEFALVCANLPYIPRARLAELDVTRHEPLSALDGGEDGFDFYRKLLARLSGKMAPDALILCEIDLIQKTQALELAQRLFPTATVRVQDDLAGLSRVLEIVIHP